MNASDAILEEHLAYAKTVKISPKIPKKHPKMAFTKRIFVCFIDIIIKTPPLNRRDLIIARISGFVKGNYLYFI